jgi:hypothetical protein
MHEHVSNTIQEAVPRWVVFSFLLHSPKYNSMVVHMGFVVGKVLLDQVDR